MLISSASAVVYNVKVFGVRSANELAQSDYKVSMETIKQSYKDFQQDSHLTEYFYQDYESVSKSDLNEALSWLIDHNIIQRDNVITISQTDANMFPTVSLTRYDVEQFLPSNVKRSDFIMYLYKSVFGPINSRPVGFETPNFRTYKGQIVPFSKMIKIFEDQRKKYEAGDTSIEVERYSPQGDEYTKIFGDTNIFIAENNIKDNLLQGGDANSVYGDAEGGSVSGNEINIESDYKRIDYQQGADLFLYYSGDVIELYLASALSKGVLNSSKHQITKEFIDDYNIIVRDSKNSNGVKKYAAWDKDNKVYVPNMSVNQMMRPKATAWGDDSKCLGVNHSITSTNNTLTVTRNNFLNSNTGYFTTEKLTKMDAYNLIYDFIYAKEKKMSELEVDLVNYKFGMELDGAAKAGDVKVLKYLIAKGILNYDSTEDILGLYSPIYWTDMIPILYRVANKDARLDFTSIQLTDSEKQWKAKGYAPQTLAVTDVGGKTTVSVNVPDSDENYIDTAFVDANGDMHYRVNLRGATPSVDTTYSTLDAVMIDNNIGLDTSFLFMDKDELLKMLDEYIRTGNETQINSMLHNMWVLMYYHNSGELLGEMTRKLQEWDKSKEGQTKGAGFINVMNDLNKEYSIIKAVSKPSLDYTGKNKWKYGNISWYAVNTQKLPSGAGSYMASAGLNPSKQEDVARAFLQTVSSIHLIKTDSKNQKQEQVVVVEMDNGRERVCTDASNIKATVKTMAQSTDKVDTDAEVKDFQAKSSQLVSNSKALKAVTTDNDIIKIQASEATGVQYVSLNSIDAYNKTVGTEKQIPISKVSDLVLYNDITQSYAYFSQSTKQPVALVGTAVLNGDPALGVAFKSGSGEGAEYYYLLDAIKLLISTNEATAIVGGVRNVAVGSSPIAEAESKLPLISSGGETMSNVYAIKAMISNDVHKDEPAKNNNPLFVNAQTVHNTKWGQYVSLASSNRVMNVLYSPIQYESGGKQTVAYKVLKLKPSNKLDKLGSHIGPNATIQDLLDAPGKPPDSKEGQEIWSANKTESNVFCNWLYGTSGQTFIHTGYLVPEAYLYVMSEASITEIPASYMKPLTSQQIKKVSKVTCSEFNGAVVSTTTKLGNLNAESFSSEVLNGKPKASYYLSDDLNIIISDGRLFAHYEFYNVLKSVQTADGGLGFTSSNGGGSVAKPENGLGIGRAFKSKYPASSKISDRLPARVIATKGSSVVARVGPLYGPIYKTYDNKVGMLNDNDAKLILSDSPSLDFNVIGKLYARSNISKEYDNQFGLYRGIKFLGVAGTNYIMSGTPNVPQNVTPDNMKHGLVLSGGALVSVRDGEIKDFRDKYSIPTSTTASDVKSSIESISRKSGYKPNQFAAYFDIMFDASKFSVNANGELIESDLTLTDITSSALYSNLNDVIIDGMITQAEGAIPLGDVPVDALVQIGENWYTPVMSNDGKKFIGYSHLPDSGISEQLTEAEATLSLMPQMIRIGNQIVNVAHFLTQFELLHRIPSEYAKPLTRVVDNTLSKSPEHKFAIMSSSDGKTSGDVLPLTGSKSVTPASKFYTPIAMKFAKGLLVKKVSAAGAEPELYQLVPVIDPKVAGVFDMGALAKLPFWNDSVLNASLRDITLDVMGAGFLDFKGATELTNLFKERFKEALHGDLIELIRFIAFLILIWLGTACWVCYACKASGITNILENIRYPTSNTQQKGVDLLRIISLNTITLDTELPLSRFLLYEFTIAVLIVVVWKINIGG